MSEASPSISVVIPAHNRERYIARAINSVLAQTSPATEIIVVDDGSDDSTAEIAEGYGESVRLIRIENNGSGPSRPRNIGIEAATSTYITLLDSDDYFCTTLLERHRALAQRCPAAGLISGNFSRDKTNSDRLELNKPTAVRQCRKSELRDKLYHIASDEAYATLCRGNFITSCTGATFRKTCWEDVSGFDEGLSTCNDYDFFFRVLSHYDMGYIDEPLFVYVYHDDNISAANRSGDFKPHRCINRLHVVGRELGNISCDRNRNALRRHARNTMLDLAYGYRSLGRYRNAFLSYVKCLRYGGNPWPALFGMGKVPIAYILGK